MNYYFLGIGGIGMSALARYFHQQGDQVAGYDRTPSPLTRKLEEEGIAIHYVDDPQQIPQQVDEVIYTPAIPADMTEYQQLQASGVPMKKRAQVLGELSRGKRCIAIAGSHGKTSISSMVAHILSHSDLGCSAFIGGISKNWNSNLLVNTQSDYVVVEADEYDRSFLWLHPYCALISATDADHLDVYGSREQMVEAYHQFAEQVEPDGILILKQGITLDPHEEEHRDEEEHSHHHDNPSSIPSHCSHFTYTSHGIEADYYPWNLRNYNGDLFFDLRTPNGVLYDLQLPAAPLYNVENAVAAAAITLSLGVLPHQLRYGLKTYCGVKRRFDYRIRTKELVMIDDYAHHPQEIEACLQSIRFLYPGKRVVGVFQPHLYSRTRDFADQFAQVLSTLDEVVLLPIYPAREKPIPGVSSSMILRKIGGLNQYLCTPDQAVELVPALCPDIVVTLGAGDIDRLVPRLQEALSE